ncbi:MAG TPA: DUF885 domain-containing protein [Thermoanaerobaculia bacterium]|nr:DUF885 domain-containing protein [Thermoanaerobaculia bacterium]
MRRALLLTLLLLSPFAGFGQEVSAADLDRRRKMLADLIDEHWEYVLRTSPEYASLLGDKRYNDRSSDLSPAALRRDAGQNRAFLRRVEAIGTVGFSDQEKINKALLARNIRESIESYEMNEWQMPVTQMSGIHLSGAQFPSLLGFATAKDYDDYIARMRSFPRQIDDTIAAMRVGMRSRLVPPRFLIEKVAGQAESIAATAAEQSVFATPLRSFPDGVSEAEKTRIQTEFLDAVRKSMIPAYRKFATFVRNEYMPAGRTDAGIWSVPNGAALYAMRARQSTTTSLTPGEIHAIGLREVARIETEMLEIAKKLGFDDLKSFNASIEANPELRARSPEQILGLYRRYIDQMYAQLPRLFGRLPQAKVEVVEVEAYRAREAAAANYNAPALDGSRPGRVYVNTWEPQARKIISFESTAYHEGVPGHHMQIAIAQELTDLPAFRREGRYTAYVEGWALYSEVLGKEVGFYESPYSDYGRLQDEMLRAIRLVVDTGLHTKRWTREQVVQYFHDHSALDEVEIQSETDRYIVWPGQALGYKIGQLRILELRKRARRELGERFDVRGFHDEVLGSGALPLDLLEQRVNSWIARGG